jgi:hypothetical protein
MPYPEASDPLGLADVVHPAAVHCQHLRGEPAGLWRREEGEAWAMSSGSPRRPIIARRGQALGLRGLGREAAKLIMPARPVKGRATAYANSSPG